MRFRSTFILFLAVAALGSFIWFVERKGDATGSRADRERLALRVDASKVTALSIVSGNLQIDCEKQGHDWLITNPVKTRADVGGVERILDELEHLPKGEVITADEQEKKHIFPAAYGLDQPRVRLVLRTEQRDITLLIGRDAPLGGALYMMEAGTPEIVSTATNILTVLPRTVVDLRDRKIFQGLPANVTRIDVRRPEGFLQLARDAQGSWRIQKPVSARAAAGAVQDLLDKLYELRVRDFVADSVAASSLYGLDEPVAQVTLTSEKEEQAFLLGKATERGPDEVYAMMRGVEAVYSVPSNCLDQLRVKADSLRDRRLVTLPAYEVSYIEMNEGERVVKLLLTNGVWFVVEPKQYRADEQRVQVLLSEWTGAKAEAYNDEPTTNLAEVGLAPPARKIMLARNPPAPASTNAAGPVAEEGDAVRILVSTVDVGGDRVMMKVEGEDSLYIASSDPIHAISLDPLYYRDHEILALNPSSVRALSVQRGAVEESAERESTNAFRAANGGKQKIDQAAVGGILDAVRALRAVDLIAEDPSDLSLYGLDAPAATLAIGLTGGAGLGKSLLVGKGISGNYAYAMIKGQDVVFTLEKAVADKLTHGLYNNPLPSQEPTIENGTNRPAAAP